MASYLIHTQPVASSGPQHAPVRFVRDGASLLALVFPLVWLVWNRLWFALACYLIVVAALGSWSILANDPSATILSALPGLYFWLEGNNLIAEKLERQGWEQVAIVDASSLVEAEIRYFEGFGADDLSDRSAQREMKAASGVWQNPAATPPAGRPSGISNNDSISIFGGYDPA
ncbi:MAG: DUF2628 domain-containing protein [Rhizobiaceae bacterium]